MEVYPLDQISKENWDEDSDVGIEHMRASDGSYKSHILYAVVGYSFSFVHPILTLEDFNRLIKFWSDNYMFEFEFTSPLDGRKTLVRFERRPKIIGRESHRLSVQVNLIGKYI